MTSAPSTSRSPRPSDFPVDDARRTALPRFTWNRAHGIGIAALGMLLILLVWASGLFVIDPALTSETTRTVLPGFAWQTSMIGLWPVGLGLANLILGSIRSGSLSFPLASALLGPVGFGWASLRLMPGGRADWRYLPFADWLALMRTEGLRLAATTLGGCLILLAAYAAIAFVCFAIGRYGLRELFVDPPPASASGRLLAWIRRDTVRFGCWLTVVLIYGTLLGCAIAGGGAAMVGALLINFVIPPVLLVACGAYASREESLAHPWRALLFPLVCTLAAVPLLVALIHPFDDVCVLAIMCEPAAEGGSFDWSSMSDVWHFTVVFAVFSFLGFGVVWLVRRIAAAVRTHGARP
ncbi:hypothetical protein [Bifidobacterium sp. SO4]|uniref:hypothetical protein n=1 Tax=Bifidobacterium sp. SO4 TaxID=2809030 RepID=UPI001BDD0D02|nr:hypothetical protein [Bifidobacterium sp. SO4]MBT1171678.1 hypothetical protein [Bifidobacterium sp. SO4]